VPLSRASEVSEDDMFEDEEYDEEFYDEEYDEEFEDEEPEKKGFPACNLITFKEIVSDVEMVSPKKFFPESFAFKRLVR